ncbi:MAG: 50S ribosomal protein L18 [Candidatus Aenigmarchaeota archaeon]|nr:50S ribosomal protein L18 [Candidatus Aenigmarchaeota archaeon]
MQNARYLLHFKRRREGKTNYKKRLQLLMSKTTRLVIRNTNNQIITQLINYKEKGDITVIGVNSKELETYSWKHSKKNIPAAYLTGFLLAQKAKNYKITNAIVDTGLQTMRPGTKIYALIKGVIDGGIKINTDESVFPKEERITGLHIDKYKKTKIADDFKTVKTKIAAFKPVEKTATAKKIAKVKK